MTNTPGAALPRSLRDRLAKLILASLCDRRARRRLERLATATTAAEHAIRDLFSEAEWERHANRVRERAGRASIALRKCEIRDSDPGLGAALNAAAALFDAGLYFEVHELLEPHWARARDGARDALKGLIQIAVGFQHLANGNRAGARVLLSNGYSRMLGRRLGDVDLDAFGRQARDCLKVLEAADGQFDWARVPFFPAAARSTKVGWGKAQ